MGMFVLFAIVFATPSCKRKEGKTILFFPFRSRKARLTGEWQLNFHSSTPNRIYSPDGYKDVHFVFRFKKCTRMLFTYNYNSQGELEKSEFEENYNHEYSIEFKKDGSYSSTNDLISTPLTQLERKQQRNQELGGFLGKSEELDLKKRKPLHFK